MGSEGVCVISPGIRSPQGNPVQTALPGHLPLMCCKHRLHGWLNWIIINLCLFGEKKNITVIYHLPPPSPSPYPEIPFPTKSLSHAKPMNCDTLHLSGRDNGEQKTGERYGEQPWLRLLHSPYEDEWKEPWWREGGWSGTRKETKQNPAHGGPCPWEKVCVSVCKCV